MDNLKAQLLLAQQTIAALQESDDQLRKECQYDRVLLRLSELLEKQDDILVALNLLQTEVSNLLVYKHVWSYVEPEDNRLELLVEGQSIPQDLSDDLQALLAMDKPVIINTEESQGSIVPKCFEDNTHPCMVYVPLNLQANKRGVLVFASIDASAALVSPNNDELDVLLTISKRFSMLINRIETTAQLTAMQAHLDLKHERMIAMQDFLEEVYYRASVDGVIAEISPSIYKVSGYHASELLGCSVLDYYDIPAQRDAYIKALLEHGKVRDFPISMRAKNGDLIEFSMNSRLIFQDGKPISIEGMMIDQTERFQLQADLRQARDDALAANKAKSEFLAVMSHELRTPIHGLIGMQQLIGEEPLSDTQREYLQSSQYSARSLHALVNDILDLSKIEAGAMDLSCSQFNLFDCIQATMRMVAYDAKQSGLSLFFVSQSLPLMATADMVRLRQVLLNLLTNAVKFTPHGFVRLYCGLTADQQFIQFRIEDSGIGMSVEYLSKLFDPFTQEDSSTTRKYHGTGLGTTIAKRLLELMDGELKVESHLGQGSCFSFTIPAQGLSIEQVSREVNILQDLSVQAEPVGLLAMASPKPCTWRVLLAEDDPIGQKIMSKALQRSSFEVSVVADGLDALALAKQQNFDLILLDMQMPGLDGASVAEKFRQFEHEQGRQRTLVIGLTAHALDEVEQRCRHAGMDDFFTKPVDVNHIVQRLERCLR